VSDYCECCVLSGRVCQCVWSRSLKNVAGLTRVGLLQQKNKYLTLSTCETLLVLRCFFWLFSGLYKIPSIGTYAGSVLALFMICLFSEILRWFFFGESTATHSSVSFTSWSFMSLAYDVSMLQYIRVDACLCIKYCVSVIMVAIAHSKMKTSAFKCGTSFRVIVRYPITNKIGIVLKNRIRACRFLLMQ
jgi:hypothetical protein